MKLKRLLAIVLGLVMLFALTGCVDPDAGKIKLYVNVYKAGFGDAWLTATARAFEKLHPDVKVVTDANVNMDTMVRNRLEAKQYEKAGDVFTFTNQVFFEEAVRKGHIEDLTAYYDKEVENGKTLDEIVEQNFLSFVTVQGKRYGIPWEGGVVGFAYNAKMFEKHDWKIPANMNEFYALCKQINADEPQVSPLIYCGGVAQGYFQQPMLSWMSSYEGKEDSDTFFKLESAEVFKAEGRLKAYEEVARITSDPTIVHPDSKTNDHLAAQREFLLGNAAMVVTGSWLKTEMSEFLEDLPGFEMGMFTPPALGDGLDKDGKPARLVNTGNCDTLAINSHSTKKELAYEFMTFMHTQEMLELYVEKTGGNPRPFKFERTDWSSLGTWGESLMRAWQVCDNIFPYSTAPIFAEGKLGFWPGKTGDPVSAIRDAKNAREAMVVARDCYEADFNEAQRRYNEYNK